MPNAGTLDYRTTTKPVLDLLNLYRGDNLNLNPGFQRQSVWSERDRAKLVSAPFRYSMESAGLKCTGPG